MTAAVQMGGQRATCPHALAAGTDDERLGRASATAADHAQDLRVHRRTRPSHTSRRDVVDGLYFCEGNTP